MRLRRIGNRLRRFDRDCAALRAVPCPGLACFEEAVGVQTVHDSVVVECRRSDASAVASTVKSAMEEAMQIWCPDIPAQADTDIRNSLSDHDIIETI